MIMSTMSQTVALAFIGLMFSCLYEAHENHGEYSVFLLVISVSSYKTVNIRKDCQGVG